MVIYNNYKGVHKDIEAPLLFLHLAYKYTRLNYPRKIIDVPHCCFMHTYSLNNFGVCSISPL